LNIYVGNLPKTTDEQTIRNLFEEYGEVTEVKLIKDKFTDELRGAIQEVNGTELEGSTLSVNEARPRKDRSGGGHRGS